MWVIQIRDCDLTEMARNSKLPGHTEELLVSESLISKLFSSKHSCTPAWMSWSRHLGHHPAKHTHTCRNIFQTPSSRQQSTLFSHCQTSSEEDTPMPVNKTQCPGSPVSSVLSSLSQLDDVQGHHQPPTNPSPDVQRALPSLMGCKGRTPFSHDTQHRPLPVSVR